MLQLRSKGCVRRSLQDGRDLLWPRPTLANSFSYFGHGLTDFGHGQFWAFSRVRSGRGGVGRGNGGSPGGRAGGEGVGINPEKEWGPEGLRTRRVGPEMWGPEGWGPNPEKGWRQEGWGQEEWARSPEGWGAQNFALFFPSPASIFILFFSLWGSSRVFFSLQVSSRVFLPLSGGLLVEFWWCFGRSGLQMCLFSPSGCPVEAPTACRPALQTPPKFHEKTPRERKRAKMGAGDGKKNAKFWAVRRSGGGRSGGGRSGGGRSGGGRSGPEEGGPRRRGGVRWPKSAWPPKIGQAWSKSAKPRRVGKVGQNLLDPTKIDPSWPS